VDDELFWISGSSYARRVQLALEHKGVAYVSRRLDAGKSIMRLHSWRSIRAARCRP
jgi:glutathione S-transferase